jgi:hypothetical protein
MGASADRQDLPLGLLRGADGEDDVAASDREEGVALGRPAVEGRQGDLGESEEIALGGVQHVGDAAAIPVAGEREETFDAVAGGLDADALLAVLHKCLLGCPPRALGIAHASIIDPRRRGGGHTVARWDVKRR